MLASDLQVQTDAAVSVGCSAICGEEWFTGCWLDLQSRCCITYMGLYPNTLACASLCPKETAKRIEFLTDNQAVAACITSGICRCFNVMSLLRALFFVCAKNITVRSLLLTFLVRPTQTPMLYPDRNGTDSVS